MTSLALVLAAAAALVSAGLILALRPVLVRYALARPNARSSHRVPTPQGGGIAVVAAVLVTVSGLLALDSVSWLEVTGILTGDAGAEIVRPAPPVWLAVATLALAAVGAVDDLRPLPASLRLMAQAIAVATVVFSLPDGSRALPEAVPVALERALAVLVGIWFVNLVNFMDGIDWMTVAEIVPATAAILVFAGLRHDAASFVVAAALLGAVLGFTPFNKPVAKLFLGDVGSLPIGLLTGWMLYRLAISGAFAAALILPLYYLADATLTLARRAAHGERVWQAHRTHYYQRATDNGFTVSAVVGHVFALNLVLALLAGVTLLWPDWMVSVGALLIATALVLTVLRRFATPRLSGALA